MQKCKTKFGNKTAFSILALYLELHSIIIPKQPKNKFAYKDYYALYTKEKHQEYNN
ncbi:22018_t:CDS:1, partial [Dentiscutata erythropus]